jgi:hypothetical protein
MRRVAHDEEEDEDTGHGGSAAGDERREVMKVQRAHDILLGWRRVSSVT